MADYQNILEFIKNKDPNGLQELYRSYGRKFYGYAVKKWNLSEDEAWEVVYKTLETLVLKLPNYQFESEAHFNNFLYKVFTNFLRQNFRSQRANQNDIKYININEDPTEDNQGLPSNKLRFEIDKQTFNEYYQLEALENPKLLLLNVALEKLPVGEKDILLLRAQGFSYEEVAQLLKVNNNQLKVKHHRAKQKLLKILEETIKTQSHE